MKKLLSGFILILMILSITILAGASAAVQETESMTKITKTASASWTKGSEENFTGDVGVKILFFPNETSQSLGAYVNFKAGARTNWHSHSNGQRLLVTDGVGWIQQWGEPVKEIRPGDVIWFPPGVKHWHGASPDSEMTHLALMEAGGEGPSTEWLEPVSDKQYAMSSNSAETELSVTDMDALSSEQQSIVLISAFTAGGEMENLKTALGEGLDAGLTINEIKEVLVHVYAYAGFPRSLNGLGVLRTILEERQARGIEDEVGETASPLPENKSSVELGREVQTELLGGRPFNYEFVPVMDQFLKGHLFGDIFGRDILDYKTRELVTVSALANMNGVNSQLSSHFFMAFNTGVTEAEMKTLISLFEARVGQKEADNAENVLSQILSRMSE